MNIDLDGIIQLEPQDLIESGGVVLGARGRGKSNLVSVLIEEHAPHLPFIVCDVHGEYWTLREKFDALVIGRSDHVDMEVEPAQAAEITAFCYENGASLILDLLYFSFEERQAFVEACFTRLWALALRHKKPYLVVLEEAHNFVPEFVRSGTKTLMKQVALEGRKFGLGMLLCTQTTTEISKTVLKMMGIRFLLQVFDSGDLKQYEKNIPLKPAEVREMVDALEVGQAIVVNVTKKRRVDVVKIRRRTTSDTASTPDVSAVKLRPVDAAMLEELRKLSGEVGDTPPAADTGEVEALRQQIADLEARLAEAEERHADEEARIVDAYEAQVVELGERHEQALAEIKRLNKQLRAMLMPPAPEKPVAVPLPSGSHTMQVETIEAGSLRIAERTTTVTERYAEETHVSSRQLAMRVKRQEGGFARLLSKVKRLPPASRRILAVSLEEDSAMTAEAFARLLDYAVRTVSDRLYTLQALGLVSRVDKHHWQGAGWQTLAEDYPDLDTGTLFVELMEVVEE